MKTLAYIICYLIYPFSFLFPRSSRRLAFGSYRGGFSDNSKYLFIYAVEHYRDLDCCWLSVNRKTVQYVRSLGLPAYWVLSPIGAWKALRAKYWFVNSYSSDIMYCLSGNATVVNLWHGVGLKRCEFNIKDGALADRYVRQTFKERFYYPSIFRRPDYLLSSTPFQTTMFASAFRIPTDKCLELGYPRNVILKKSKDEILQFVKRYEPQTTDELIARIRQFDKVYIYMPTWRDSQKNIFAQHLDLRKLSETLKSQNAVLLLKPHPNAFVGTIYQAENLILLSGTIDIYSVLPFTDVLITDYSSILYDYIIMPGKDVILYLYDYEEYIRERDFYYPFDENVVGKRVATFEDLLKVIVEQNYKMSEQKRAFILSKFWGDTMNKDVCAKILKQLNITCEA